MKHSEKTVRRFKYVGEGENLASKIDSLPNDLKISKFYLKTLPRFRRSEGLGNIGAGSIVNKDIPANVLAVGSPAKVIKTFIKN